MNQILYKTVYEPNNFNSNNERNKFIIIFIVAIILILIAISFYFFLKYQLFQNEKISKNLVSNYNIMTLYSNNNNDQEYIAEPLSTNQNKEPFVIGLIQIDEINLTYPILSTTTDELLKISPCRFARSYAKSNSEIYVLQVITT